jgi:hypothetical protein
MITEVTTWEAIWTGQDPSKRLGPGEITAEALPHATLLRDHNSRRSLQAETSKLLTDTTP